MKTKREVAFESFVASDIVRDGLALELQADGEIVAEVFRGDSDHSLTITTFNASVPLVEIEKLIARARDILGTFEDGTPLPQVPQEPQ